MRTGELETLLTINNRTASASENRLSVMMTEENWILVTKMCRDQRFRKEHVATVRLRAGCTS